MVERLYNLVLLLASPVWGLWLVWRLVGQRKDRRAFGQRWWGVHPDALPEGAGPRTPRVWIHAVSVGEVMAVAPLVTALRRAHPQALLVGSTVTDLGQETMKAKLPDLDAVFYLPFDLGWSVRRTLDSVRPTLLLFAETELWPNLLLALRRRGVPAVMVNGRVSERSVRRYGWIGPFIRRVVRSLEALTVQRDADRERFITLGADPGRVIVCGNLKADGATAPAVDCEALRRACGLEMGTERLIVVGSTHDPEERLAVQAFLAVAADDAGLRLCLAPRHLNRCGTIEADLRGMGVAVVRRSRLPASGRRWTNAREIVLLDTMGELAAGYELASVVIMGGTFAPIGGHNLLEPAAAGRPVLFGPHVGQWKAIAEELAAAGGAVGITDDAGLGRALRSLLADDATRRRMGEAARAYVRSQQGATDRTMRVVARVLEQGPVSGAVPIRTVDRPAGVADWLWQAGAWTDAAKLALAPAAWLYGTFMAIRRAWYRRGWLAVERLPARVISVGNVTVGGSGKTPVVMAMAGLIASTGRTVGVVTRGYRGVRSEDPLLVSDGRSIRATVEEAGDEAILLARRLNGVPVAVGRNRAAAGLLLSQGAGPDVVIMDDGFQHLALHRDLNLLVIDGARPGLDQRLLPCGPLRESWSAVRDASAVIVVDRSGASAGDGPRLLLDRLKGLGFDGPLFLARMVASGLTAVPSGDPLPIASLTGTALAICSGIGHPESFRSVVARAGGRVVREWVYEDHHRYTDREVATMTREGRRSGATALVTTEKDAVKLGRAPGELPVVAVRMAVVIEPEAEWRRWLTLKGVLPGSSPSAVGPKPSAGTERPSESLCGPVIHPMAQIPDGRCLRGASA